MKQVFVALLMAYSAVTLADAKFAVKSVDAHQRYPWSGQVDIVVAIQGCADEIASSFCTFAAKDNATGAAQKIVTIKQVGTDTVSNGVYRRRYLWNAAKDIGAVKIDELALTVSAKIGGVQLWEYGPWWAECNIGASTSEEYGYYFWWGDDVGYKRNSDDDGWVSVKDGTSFTFTSENCPTYYESGNKLQSLGYVDSARNLVPAHDAAKVHLGELWRMPTSAEFTELTSNCDTTWTVRNGVYGRLVTGRGSYASKSIFLPVAGYGCGSDLKHAGSDGYYWTSTAYSGISWDSFGLHFYSLSFGWDSTYYRYYGRSVRPVRSFTQPEDDSGISTNLKLDCRTGVRTCSVEGETLRYDALWFSDGDEVRISDNGTVITNGFAGSCEWRPTVDGSLRHQLKLEVLSEGQVVDVETAQFEVTIPIFVKDVEAHQHNPRDGLVDITVTLQGDTNKMAITKCVFSATNVVTQMTVCITNISQIGADAITNDVCIRLFRWNAATDIGEIMIDDLALTVNADFDCVQLWENGPYWLECNVGAKKPEEYGDYFWWGDTVGYRHHSSGDGWVSVKDGSAFSFSTGNCLTYGKTSTLFEEGYVDSEGNLVATHDAATVNLGTSCRMPTDADFSALIDNCTTVWTTRNGVKGWVVSGQGAYASRSIFLPAAGEGDGTCLSNAGWGGGYWSSTSYTTSFGTSSCYAWGLAFGSESGRRVGECYRNYGYTIRPIRENAGVAESVTTHLNVDCRTEINLIPDLGENPTVEDITNILKNANAADPNLSEKITNGTEYVAFRAWAGKVQPHGGGNAVGAAGVMAAPNAWLSYALGSQTLIEKTPEDGDLTVEKFEPKGEDGKFDFTVSVKDVEIGSDAAKENLKQVFGIEGGTSLESGGMSSSNVDITFGTPQDGKVKFTAGPNAKNADAKTFFMKVKINP